MTSDAPNAGLVLVGTATQRQTIQRIYYTVEFQEKVEQSMADLLIYGHSTQPQPGHGDVVVKPFRPNLP